MKNHIFGFIFIGLLFLSSCTVKQDEVAIVTPEKSPFYIDTYSLDSASVLTNVEKTGRVSARSTLTLSAKGVGEVGKIEVKEGSNVKAGAVLVRLKDTLTNYDLQLAQAENALKIQNANRETTSINLSSAVGNARITYDRAQQAYETLMNRNSLQYDITVSANKKTLDAYNESFRSYISELEKSMTQYLHEGDKILGITTIFQYTNDSWESYLGARIGSIKADADNEWNKVYTMRGELRARMEKGLEIDRDNPEADIELIARGYDIMRDYLDTMLYMLQNNVIGGGLPQIQQDAWMLAWNGYRSQVGGGESGYNAWKAQTSSFFKNYKKTELATKLAIKSLDGPLNPEDTSIINADIDLKTTYENTKIDLVERTRNVELSLEQAKLGYENAKSIQSATLTQLDASRKTAEISLELARRNAENLLIRAPVNGTISKVLTSIGQSVATNTPVVEFTSNEPEMLLDIESNLARTLSVGQDVVITIDDSTHKGTIIALSSVAGKNLLSSIRIAVIGGQNIIGKTAKIVFSPRSNPLESGVLSIPLEAVRIIAENEGEIRYLQDNNILTKTISIVAIRSGFVETSTLLDGIDEIIVTDTTNYNSEKNTLIVQ